jgi:hypothetical protein
MSDNTDSQEAGDFPQAADADLADETVKFLAVKPGTVAPNGSPSPAAGYSASLGQVAAAAVPAAAAAALSAAASAPPIVLSGATTLTADAHGGKTLVLQSGASISLAWTDTGNGFACLLLNRSGAIIAPVLVGFSNPLPVNGNGEIALPSTGAASILCITPDGGTTAECWLIGDTAS